MHFQTVPQPASPITQLILELLLNFLRQVQKKWKAACRLVKTIARLHRRQKTNKIWTCWLEVETKLDNIAEKDWIS